MSYTYATFQQALALEMIIPNANVSDANFQAILPTIVDEAEQRCYRDLDLLYATSVQSLPATGGSRIFDISAADPYVVVVERMRLLLPAGSDSANYTSAPPLTPVSVEVLDAVYSGAAAGPPTRFAMQSDTIVILGPAPDDSYNIEISGVFRPTPIYNVAPQDGTQTTWLATVLPDLFLAAAMVSAAGYRHNFGAQADDPRMATSWEMRYQENLKSAQDEELRKSYHGWAGLSSDRAPPPAPPPAAGA